MMGDLLEFKRPRHLKGFIRRPVAMIPANLSLVEVDETQSYATTIVTDPRTGLSFKVVQYPLRAV